MKLLAKQRKQDQINVAANKDNSVCMVDHGGDGDGDGETGIEIEETAFDFDVDW